ncbi:S1-C subfamily serine protease [Prosthecobacter fusiformis]|uniref:S1-C subfamily serine protease n=1 Tax=Prosthecobacter fusiformis TaxID=48464 RepID=A0A4R7RMF2_9BACT|nr:S1C family serine protease [Prosthecobacter fusiformis]TDU66502.1 S1-C subfamily serine protease [Prosthecobacter fusiformis]
MKMRFLIPISAALAFTAAASAQELVPDTVPAASPPPIEAPLIDEWEGIVNIEVSVLVPDYREPWNSGQPSGGSGTGFLIGKNRFLTNAHVVSNASKLVIRTTNDPEPHPARVVFVAHDCDLAIIEAEDGSHFDKLKPLTFGGIPKLNTEVIAVGYPIGGDRISVTRGVVSRIDFRPFSHTQVDSHLAIQVDAAINPGNSGGPVIQSGKVVGVAFQGFSGRVAQNVGYIIPVPVVERFLKDVEDGTYDHYVDLAVSDFAIENSAQRKALGLNGGGIGVMIADVEPAGSAGDILKRGDVLLSMDDNPVFNNGLIRFEGELMDMNEVVERKFAGDKLKLAYQRDGKKTETEVTLKRFDPYVKLGEQYDQRPRYVVYAGLVFQPMDKNLMDAHQIADRAANYMFDNFLTEKLYVERPEPVLLTTILADEVNTYITPYAQSVVDEINGVKIKSLKDVKDALAKKGEKPGFVVIKLLEKGRPLVLKRDFADAAHPRIMQTYNITEDAYLGAD